MQAFKGLCQIKRPEYPQTLIRPQSGDGSKFFYEAEAENSPKDVGYVNKYIIKRRHVFTENLRNLYEVMFLFFPTDGSLKAAQHAVMFNCN